MIRRRAEEAFEPTWRLFAPPALALASVGITIALIVSTRPDRVDTLSVVLGIAAVIAGVTAPSEGSGRLSISSGFIVSVLAAAFLGPASAVLAAMVVEVCATVMLRTDWRAMLFNNVPTALIGAIAAASVVRAFSTAPHDTADFYLAVALAGLASNTVGFLVFTFTRRLVVSGEQFGLSTFLEFLPSTALSILVVVAGTGITLEVGNAGIAFALAGVFAFTYMAHLLYRSRGRAEQYVSLSWGVLAGLMRSLDIRDQRAARHCAAVAGFARDIARSVGMDDAQCELAHTAGLLHDIGRFALSDRVAERGRELTEDDWMAIQQHPELGADMLRDLGMYGPVAEIILAHHERIDGRGYPRALAEDEIPEIAKIIAVAEVYDTLTASDTYRTQMSSFEALRELRRVSGSQLDGGYVEVLAELLTGEGVDYRHADMADFDRELNMERRIRQAGAGA